MIDHVTGMATPVATTRQGGQLVEIGALAFASDGTLYGVAVEIPSPVSPYGRIDLATETFVPLLPIPTRLSEKGIDTHLTVFCMPSLRIDPRGISADPSCRSTSQRSHHRRESSPITARDGSFNVGDIDYAPTVIAIIRIVLCLVRIDPVTGV